MTAITDAVGHGADLQFILRRLEEQAAAQTNTSNENARR